MARDFSGTAQLLYNANAVVAGVPLTMACWFNSDSVVIDQYLMTIVRYGGGSSGGFFALIAAGNVAGDPVEAQAYNPGAIGTAKSTTGYTSGNWFHACGVFAATNSRTAYLNGANKGSESTNVTPGSLSHTSIGTCYRSDDPAVYTNGRIAEAAIWGAALTDAEAAILAQGFSPLFVQPENLLAYWPLLGNTSPEIDLVGGYNLTLSASAPTKADHPRVRRPG